MFTGIVEARGRVESVARKGRSLRLALEVPAAFRRLALGSSLAVDGVCLTVSARKKGMLHFDVIPETVRRTHFGSLRPGARVNLERPLRWKARLHGHLVQGHVDAAVPVLAVIGEGSKRSYRIACPRRFSRAIVEKGSVALNGVSLTVGKAGRGSFWVHAIPHTLKKTNLSAWKKGLRVNLETDRLAGALKSFDNRGGGR